MTHSLCSVIIPVYNGAKYLNETLSNCLSQDDVLELILIEDASTDESLEILQEYKHQYPDVIRIIQHPENRGFVRGVIDGIAAASGAYVSIIGQDDLMFKGRIQYLVQAIEEIGSSMVCSNAFYIFGEQPSKKLVRSGWCKTGFIPKHAFLFKNSIIGSSVIFKKKDFARINFLNYPYRNSIEWYHWFNYACMDGVFFLADPLVYYRKHNTNISSTLYQSSEYKSYKKFCRSFILSKLTPIEIAIAIKNKLLKEFPVRKNRS
jgi:glycosyltransferase involved in cell wall biosynthesis